MFILTTVDYLGIVFLAVGDCTILLFETNAALVVCDCVFDFSVDCLVVVVWPVLITV